MKNITPVIIKYHAGQRGVKNSGGVLLFLPDATACMGRIVCYACIGQHTEAAMDYFHECKPLRSAPLSYQEEGAALLDEYRLICKHHGQQMKVVAKDTKLFRAKRYGWMKKKGKTV